MQWSQQHTLVVENIAYCWPCLLCQNQQCAQRQHLWRNPFAVSAVFVAQAPAVWSLRPPVAEHISQCLWLSRRQHHQRTQCQDQWQSTFREAWRHWQPRLQRQHHQSVRSSTAPVAEYNPRRLPTCPWRQLQPCVQSEELRYVVRFLSGRWAPGPVAEYFPLFLSVSRRQHQQCAQR